MPRPTKRPRWVDTPSVVRRGHAGSASNHSQPAQEEDMPTERKGRGRGFASMDREKQREIASKGGRAAHVQGTAHEWSSEEARAAGRKGGAASRHRAPGRS